MAFKLKFVDKREVFEVSGYAYSNHTIDVTALDNNYVLVYWYLENKFFHKQAVDFSELTGTASQYSFSNNSENLYSEPYTPASKQSPSTRVVVGEKNELVLVTNVTASPYCKIVCIECIYDEFSFYVSGVLLGPDLVLTAAHNVYRRWEIAEGRDEDGWVNECIVYTEMAGENNYYAESEVTHIIMPEKGYDGNSEYDWAYLTTETDIGTAQGWMGFSGESASNYINITVTVAGYPAIAGDYGLCYMYSNQGTITGLTGANRLAVTADTYGGMSGCPYFSADQYVRAIHKSGGTKNADGTYINNVGTYITTEMFYILRQAKQAGIDKYS